jgi:valyl-tRNA synthetase
MAFTKYFEHSKSEPEIYRQWEETGAFRADVNSDKPPFTISMPPPNATGELHLGHAVMLAIEDLLIRWRRMAGDETLWLPGTDHAAIATENRVIQNLQKAGIPDPRTSLGRDELVRQIAEFVEASRATIRDQIRAMGASCDWSRERYTMDPGMTRSVIGVFARMFRDGLIYRGPRVVNWDPALRTTISDEEIEHKERTATFYTIRYGPFEVGTSRPETKLGDTGLAVHPDDSRWKEFIGKSIAVHWPKGPTITVKVVADAQHVDMETGTGVVGLTPAHSLIDFEIAQANNLPLKQVIGEDGKMTSAAGPYAGMSVLECREAFVRDLRDAGLLLKEETYLQPVSICHRSKEPIEPLLKDQWFIDVNKPAVNWKGELLSLKQVLRAVVESGEIDILPSHEKKKYFNWIDNLRDWCISRQIWWGHRIPVWYRGPEEFYVGNQEPQGDGWVQDSDTLDTWFSSALWTWGTLIDSSLLRNTTLDLKQILELSPDFRRFHATSVMETGYDILFFWVARMIMLTTYMTGQVPFRTVYLHGLVLDEDGEKMTKTKPEKCIDPLNEIRENGADPLRMAMILNSSAGRDTKLSKDQINASKSLVNKIWNASKLVASRAGQPEQDTLSLTVVHPINRWMLARVNLLVTSVSARLESFDISGAAESVRASFWNEFCDFYLEAIKCESVAESSETPAVALHVLKHYLRLFHPFVPFVTERIWSELGCADMLIRSSWPVLDQRYDWPREVAQVDSVIRLITGIRHIRSEKGISAKVKVEVQPRPANLDVFVTCREVVERLARVQELLIDLSPSSAMVERKDASVVVDEDFTAAVSLDETDLAGERARLTKQMEREEQRLVEAQKRLTDVNFLNRAKPQVVESTRAEAQKAKTTIISIRERLGSLNGVEAT